LGETEELLQARRELAAAAEEHRRWLSKIRDLELEIESLSTKISSSEQRLYSGSVKNPKELSDIQNEIAALKRRCQSLEDELLEAMVSGEEAADVLEARRAAQAEIEARWQANQATLQKELGEVETRVVKARAEREQLRRSIQPDDLAFYDRIRARFGTVAVTTLRDGVCGFCAVAPSSTKLGRLHSGRELLECGNCGRILLDL
jgi:predicted  nucleic acid-binding Zn-ribbon protein